jgi:hypothetical protein
MRLILLGHFTPAISSLSDRRPSTGAPACALAGSANAFTEQFPLRHCAKEAWKARRDAFRQRSRLSTRREGNQEEHVPDASALEGDGRREAEEDHPSEEEP